MIKKIFIGIVSVLILAGISAGVYIYPSYSWMVAVKPVKYDSGLTIYVGGGNSTVLTSKDGSRAIIIDTKKRRAGKKLRKLVTAKDITIINTHIHQDHTRMNRLYPGAFVIAGNYSKEDWKKETGSCKYPDRIIMPNKDTTFYFEDEKVYIGNIGQAHTTNDLVIYLENHKMLVVGDLVFHRMHPALLKGDANCVAWINVLDSLSTAFDADVVIPGHGQITDKSGLLLMKDYLSSIYDAIGDTNKLLIAKKKYKYYFTFMNATGFDKNVNFIAKEKMQKAPAK